MYLTKLGVIAVLVLGTISSAQAATQCYRSEEIEADQAVQFQTKLMVLSDSCGSTVYSQFTRKNGSVLAAYQQKMIGYFRRAADGRKADAAFDRFITALANQEALRVGKEPVASVCDRSAGFLTQAGGFGNEDFRKYVTQQAVEQRASYQNCKE
jgi:hypothetical protein